MAGGDRGFKGLPLNFTETVVLPPDYETFRGGYQAFYRVREIFNLQHFYPLVLMPLTAKEYGSVTGFQGLIDQGKRLLAHTEEVFLIGYRAADQIVRELLANPPVQSGTRLHVVGRDESSAREIMERVLGFAPAMRSGRIYPGGFMAFVQNDEVWQ